MTSANTSKTVVLVTNQFKCERIIKAGQVLADLSNTGLCVLSVQSNEFPQNPEAINYLFDVSTKSGAIMNVMYSENVEKTIVHDIKEHKPVNVISGMPRQKNSILHKLWTRFTHITFFTVNEEGVLTEVTDRQNHLG